MGSEMCIRDRVYKQTAKSVYLGATVCENSNLTVVINRRVLLVNLRLRRYGLQLYDQFTAPLRLKVRMLIAEVIETMLYGCHMEPHRGSSRHSAHGSPPIAPPLHRMEEVRRDIYHMLSYADTLATSALVKTGCEILFAGFVACTWITRGYQNE